MTGFVPGPARAGRPPRAVSPSTTGTNVVSALSLQGASDFDFDVSATLDTGDRPSREDGAPPQLTVPGFRIARRPWITFPVLTDNVPTTFRLRAACEHLVRLAFQALNVVEVRLQDVDGIGLRHDSRARQDGLCLGDERAIRCLR